MSVHALISPITLPPLGSTLGAIPGACLGTLGRAARDERKSPSPSPPCSGGKEGRPAGPTPDHPISAAYPADSKYCVEREYHVKFVLHTARAMGMMPSATRAGIGRTGSVVHIE